MLSFLLLWRAFRAPVIALKAGVFTILSIVAAYGVVAYVAEGGWAGQLIGIDSDLPVPPFIPVMMFAVTFGLAMDYEVFIVSRMKEERERLGDAREAVIVGLARTSKVITAAALIMVSVFGAFALSTELILKLIGVGLASAILIDGILIRMVLLPAVMHLLGERAWWRRGGKRTRDSVRTPPPRGCHMIEAHGLTKRYGDKTAVEDRQCHRGRRRARPRRRGRKPPPLPGCHHAHRSPGVGLEAPRPRLVHSRRGRSPSTVRRDDHRHQRAGRSVVRDADELTLLPKSKVNRRNLRAS